ncbi:MAG: GNAT family N-acetyltransferase [Firmicutes bacterium]|nr:GNAT family N-acetyltransferase [Bacillota bacterium]
MEVLDKRRKYKLLERINNYKNRHKENYLDHNVIKTVKNNDVCLFNVLLSKSNNPNISFYRIRIFNYKEHIGYVNYSMDIGEENSNLYIRDINIEDKWINEGIGTKIIEYLEKIANLEGLVYIRGELSEYDIEDHGDRLINFYNKNGFQIKVDKIIKFL